VNNIHLESASSDDWLHCVLLNFDEFLIDHAANERKASSMAMSLVAHYPDKKKLVSSMIDLAVEELNHFRQVMRLLEDRNLIVTADEKDPYVNEMRTHVRKGPEEYFLDRLLSGAVIEARGEERFRRISESLEDEKLKNFYSRLAISERGHHELFVKLANTYFEHNLVSERLDEWLTIEEKIIRNLPIRSRLH